jgi:hypothetical protein
MEVPVTRFITSMAFVVVVPGVGYAQQSGMPKGMTHEEHLAQMKKDADLKARGARAMGFDQDRATHHFVLTSAGGTIELEAAAFGSCRPIPTRFARSTHFCATRSLSTAPATRSTRIDTSGAVSFNLA